jgi:hypothetical protein
MFDDPAVNPEAASVNAAIYMAIGEMRKVRVKVNYNVRVSFASELWSILMVRVRVIVGLGLGLGLLLTLRLPVSMQPSVK